MIMATLLVATDFSPISTNAMHYAVNLAQVIKAKILLVNVYQIPVSLTEAPMVMVSADELKSSSEEKLQQLKTSLDHITSGRIEVETFVSFGNVVDELNNICEKIKPLCVVVGTKGHTGLELVFFGSTTLAAIRKLVSPVICVPPGAEFRGYRKIGFACDFEDVEHNTPASFINKFTRLFGAKLFVLHVDHEHKQFKAQGPDESMVLHSMLQESNPAYRYIEKKDIEEGINEFAESNNLDLLITVPKRHKRIERLFKTSDASQLVFHSHIPVMCVH